MPDVARKHQRIKKRKGYNTAKVASARDMLKAVYHVLKEQRKFVVHESDLIRTQTAPAF